MDKENVRLFFQIELEQNMLRYNARIMHFFVLIGSHSAGYKQLRKVIDGAARGHKVPGPHDDSQEESLLPGDCPRARPGHWVDAEEFQGTVVLGMRADERTGASLG